MYYSLAEYVYKYVHPEMGCIYVGRTKNLSTRISSHDHSANDNIPRDYESILHDSDVLYTEVANKAEAVIIETYLINTLKPQLNNTMKYDGVTQSLQLTVPEFTQMTIDQRNKKHVVERTKCISKQQKKERSFTYWKAKADKDLIDIGGTRVYGAREIYYHLLNQLSDQRRRLYYYLKSVASLRQDGFNAKYVTRYSCTMADLTKLYDIDVNNHDQWCQFEKWLRDDLLELSQRHFYMIGDIGSIETYYLLEATIYKPFDKYQTVEFWFNERIREYMREDNHAELA